MAERRSTRCYSIYKDAEVTADNEVGAHNKKQARERKRRAKEFAKRSAEVRSANAKGRRIGHRRSRREALSVAYRVQQVNRETFWALDHKRRQELGIGPSERGTLTLWAEYTSCMRNYRAKGQAFLTTNSQRARALEQHGRPRCTRTIQRAHRELHRMGLLQRNHVERSGWKRIRGQMDCLSIHLISSFVTPPLAASAGALKDPTAEASPPLADKISAGNDAGRPRGSPPTSRVASIESDQQEVAPDGREGEAVKRPLNGSDKEESHSDVIDDATTPEDPEPVDWVQRADEIAEREGVLAALQYVRERRLQQKLE